MAVIFAAAAIGGVIIGGVATYEDYSNYSDYDDYKYGDAAERRKRRIASLEKDVESLSSELSDYKQNNVNPYLSDYMKEPADPYFDSDEWRQDDALYASIEDMDADAQSLILQKEEEAIRQETQELQQRLDNIDALLRKIDQIKEENKNGYAGNNQ